MQNDLPKETVREALVSASSTYLELSALWTQEKVKKVISDTLAHDNEGNFDEILKMRDEIEAVISLYEAKFTIINNVQIYKDMQFDLEVIKSAISFGIKMWQLFPSFFSEFLVKQMLFLNPELDEFDNILALDKIFFEISPIDEYSISYRGKVLEIDKLFIYNEPGKVLLFNVIGDGAYRGFYHSDVIMITFNEYRYLMEISIRFPDNEPAG